MTKQVLLMREINLAIKFWSFVNFSRGNHVYVIFSYAWILRVVLNQQICTCMWSKWTCKERAMRGGSTLCRCFSKSENFLQLLLLTWTIEGDIFTSYLPRMTVRFMGTECDHGSQLKPASHFDNISRQMLTCITGISVRFLSVKIHEKNQFEQTGTKEIRAEKCLVIMSSCFSKYFYFRARNKWSEFEAHYCWTAVSKNESACVSGSGTACRILWGDGMPLSVFSLQSSHCVLIPFLTTYHCKWYKRCYSESDVQVAMYRDKFL